VVRESEGAGHAFVTTGPLVELKVEGRIPGEEVLLPSGGGTVKIEAHISSITPLEKALLVSNGEVIEEIPFEGERKSLDIERSIRVTESGWYHLRAEGKSEERYPLDIHWAQGFTNPIWVKVGDHPVRSREAAQYSIRWIDKLQQMAEQWFGWRSEKEREYVIAQFEEARQIYRRLARGREE
jgi:hypothetical protein